MSGFFDLGMSCSGRSLVVQDETREEDVVTQGIVEDRGKEPRDLLGGCGL